MNKQISLSALTDELAQARTRKKEFLEQMDAIIPWAEWIGIIQPFYYKGEIGNKPYPLETMLRINRRPSQNRNKSIHSQGQIKRWEREKSSVRAKVEHVFGIVKGLFGYRKTRYKDRRKQAAKLHMMFELANLYLADKRCLLA